MELFTIISIPAVICFVVGLVLLIVEMFTPGLGVPGALGVLFLIASIALQARSLTEALILTLIVIALIVAAIAYFVYSTKHGRLKKTPLVLDDQIEDTGHDYSALLGKTGITQTPLRPAGIVRIDGELYDVVAKASYIPNGAAVKVLEVDGMRIVVDQTEEMK